MSDEMIDTPLLRKVYESVQGRRCTAKEVEARCNREIRSTPSWIKRNTADIISLKNVEWALDQLAMSKRVVRELTRFTDRVLEKDVWVYYRPDQPIEDLDE